MRKYRVILVFASMAVICAMVAIATFSVITVNAQIQNASDIEERLKQRGVPVRNVLTINRIPYEIQINLQSQSDNNQLAVEDNWYMQLARREATLAYRVGASLKSFTLVVYNSRGEEISSTQTYLYPEDHSQQMVPGKLKVDNLTAKEIITSELRFSNLKLDFIDVISESEVPENGQVLLIELSADGIESANQSLPVFLDSFFRLLETSNSENGTYIVLCHLRLKNSNEEILLDYVKDLESGFSQWTAADGLYIDWFPHPELSPAFSGFDSVIPEPSQGVAQGYPVPTTPTPRPYP